MIALVGAALVTGALVLIASIRLPVAQDEAWFLQVVERTRRGDRLYRDVFYGAGPLPVWLVRAVVALTRPHLLVVRAVATAAFVTVLVAGSVALDRAGASPLTIAAFWIAATAFGAPSWGADNPYGLLSFALAALACCWLAAWWVDAGSGGGLFVAGVWCGLCVGAKQSTGLAAVAVSAALVGRTGGAGSVLWLSFGIAVGVAAWLGPLAATGLARDYVRRCYRNKTTYLATGHMHPVEGLAQVFDIRSHARGAARTGYVVVASTFVLLPVLGAAAAIGVLAATESPPPVGAVGLLAIGVAAAGAVPRADLVHVQGLAPLGLLGVALTARAATAGWQWDVPAGVEVVAGVVAVVAAAWTAVALVLAVDTRHRVPLPDGWFDRHVPHCTRLPVLRGIAHRPATDARELRALTGGRVFIVRPDASLWYLGGNLTNPTPYDYPYASAFGPDGQGAVVASIRSGIVPWVCTPGPIEGRLAPTELEAFVFGEMAPVAETPAGTVYALSAAGAAVDRR